MNTVSCTWFFGRYKIKGGGYAGLERSREIER